MTLIQAHSTSQSLEFLAGKWINCTRCVLGERCKHHALWEVPQDGHVDVLFIGEGPGEVEDLLGIPFRGPAGIWLRNRIQEAEPAGLSLGYTNLVACKPQENFAGKNRKPEDKEIISCRPRLIDFIHISKPLIYIPLGKLPQDVIDKMISKGDIPHRPTCGMYHPSYMLRENPKETPEQYVSKIAEMFHLGRSLKLDSSCLSSVGDPL